MPFRLRPAACAFLLTLVPGSAAILCAQGAPPAHPKDPVVRDAPQTQAAQQANKAAVPASVALSPDGALLAWTLRGKADRAIHIQPVKGAVSGGEQEVHVAGSDACAYADPVWSPDSEVLAFLGACAPPSADPTVPRQSEVYLWSRRSGETRQLTHLTGDLNQLAWSPDGKAVAFLFVENATRTAGALDAMKPWAGVIGEEGVEVQRVYEQPVEGSQGGFMTPEKLHVYEFSFRPASHEIAFVGANPPGENNWWVAKLYTTPDISQTGNSRTSDRDSGVKVVFDPNTSHSALHGLQIAVPRFSPDGSKIAFIGGLMSDQGSTGGDLWTVPAEGGEPTDVTPGIDGTPCFEAWTGENRLLFVEDRRGHTLLDTVDAASRQIVSGDRVDLGEVSVGGGAIKDAISVADHVAGSHGPTVAFTMQGFTMAPEIFTVAGKEKPRQMTHLDPDAHAGGRTESVEWTSGPFHVQGWLSFPAKYDPAKKYPIIVSVHEGPSASVGARWSGGGDNSWAERGYFELQPNPRGSFGQGEAFTEANRKDFGYGDLHDIEAGLDFVEAKYSIDPHREGLTGWSYGGFMTMFAVSQTHRFRAAVAGAGISDWLSYYGENSIDQWMTPFFGASVYDDPAVYAKSSAITFIKQVTTPTLVIVGDRDGECPAPQSFEFWHALRDLGVKTQLVIYPDEGHGFRNPEHIRDRAERTARWFAENMPPS